MFSKQPKLRKLPKSVEFRINILSHVCENPAEKIYSDLEMVLGNKNVSEFIFQIKRAFEYNEPTSIIIEKMTNAVMGLSSLKKDHAIEQVQSKEPSFQQMSDFLEGKITSYEESVIIVHFSIFYLYLEMMALAPRARH